MERIKKALTSPALQKGAAVLLALFVWQTVAMALNEELILVSPIAVLVRLGTIWREEAFFSVVFRSLARIAVGFFTALLVGAILAILAGRFRLLETLFFPYMAVIKAVPVASFIVLVYVWLSSKSIATFIAFLIVLPTVYTGLLTGIKAKDKRLEEMAEVFGIPPVRRFLSVRLPQIEPYILSAVSLGAGLAWKSGVAAEILSLPRGSIGEMIYYASLWLHNVDLFAWTVVLVLLSIVFEKVLVLLLKLAFRGLARI